MKNISKGLKVLICGLVVCVATVSGFANNNTELTSVVTNVKNAFVIAGIVNVPGFDPKLLRIVAVSFAPMIDLKFPKIDNKLASGLIDATVLTSVKLLAHNKLDPKAWGVKNVLVFAEEGVITPTMIFFILEKGVPAIADAADKEEFLQSRLYRFVLKPAGAVAVAGFDHNLRVGLLNKKEKIGVDNFILETLINIGGGCANHEKECIEFAEETVDWCFHDLGHFATCALTSASIYQVLKYIF